MILLYSAIPLHSIIALLKHKTPAPSIHNNPSCLHRSDAVGEMHHSERRQAGDSLLVSLPECTTSFPLLFLILLPLTSTFTKYKNQIYLLHHHVSLPLSLCWNWQEINTALIYKPPSPSPSSSFTSYSSFQL